MLIPRYALTAAVAAIGGLAAFATMADGFDVRYEGPGVQSSDAGFEYLGVETFSGRSSGSFTSDFGTGTMPVRITGVYQDVTILNADLYGGAGGSGPFASTGGAHPSYSLSLSAATNDAAQRPVPITYFGYWLSALDSGSQLNFYRGNDLVFSFGPTDVAGALGGCPNGANLYCGNPTPNFSGQDPYEPYVFVNFFDGNPLGFDRIVFSESMINGAQYESDNQTVGAMGQGAIETAIAEPSSLAIGIAGWLSVAVLALRR